MPGLLFIPSSSATSHPSSFSFLPSFLSFYEQARRLDDKSTTSAHSFARIFFITFYLFNSKNSIRNVFESHFPLGHARSFCCPCPSPICAYFPSAP